MTDLISGWFTDQLNELVSIAALELTKLTYYIMNIENLAVSVSNGILTEDNMDSAYQYVMAVAITLIILKFSWKGFEVYILWKDGDAESSPQDIIMGVAMGVVTMIIFPTLYTILGNTTVSVSEAVMSSFGASEYVSNWAEAIKTLVTSPILTILMIIYLIVFIIFYIKLLARGWELLILRLGIPIACIGLIDSDKGIFKGYIQILFKAVFTTIIQILLMNLSLRFMVTVSFDGFIAGASLLMEAFAAPALLQQILAGQGHGGLGQKISSGAMFASNIKRLIGK